MACPNSRVGDALAGIDARQHSCDFVNDNNSIGATEKANPVARLCFWCSNRHLADGNSPTGKKGRARLAWRARYNGRIRRVNRILPLRAVWNIATRMKNLGISGDTPGDEWGSSGDEWG